MTEVLQLDLEADEAGLLVPFGSQKPSTEQPAAKRDLFADAKSSSKRGLGRFFSSFRSEESQASSLLDSESKDANQSSNKNRSFRWKSDEEEKEKVRHSDRKTTTFAFPNAPVTHADQFMEPPPSEKEPKEEDEKEEEESDESDESDDEEEEDEEEETAKENVKIDLLDETATGKENKEQIQNPEERWDYEEYRSQNKLIDSNGFKRDLAKEAFGSNDNVEKKGFFGRLFGKKTDLTEAERREQEREKARKERESLRTMKVATEDTKDEKTLGEQLTQAALVVMLPEIYADDEEGEDNLGHYRSIAMFDDDNKARARAKKQAESKGKPELSMDELRPYKLEIQRLKKKVELLQRDLKSSQLEANSWKLRAKELELMLRREKGNDDNSDYDSSVNNESDDEDDGVEEMTPARDLLDIGPPPSNNPSATEQKERLVSTTTDHAEPAEKSAKEKPNFDPLSESNADSSTNTTHSAKDGLLSLSAPSTPLPGPREKGSSAIVASAAVGTTSADQSRQFIPYLQSPITGGEPIESSDYVSFSTSLSPADSPSRPRAVNDATAAVLDLSGVTLQKAELTHSRSVSLGSSSGSAFEALSPVSVKKGDVLSPTAPPPPLPPPLPPMDNEAASEEVERNQGTVDIAMPRDESFLPESTGISREGSSEDAMSRTASAEVEAINESFLGDHLIKRVSSIDDEENQNVHHLEQQQSDASPGDESGNLDRTESSSSGENDSDAYTSSTYDDDGVDIMTTVDEEGETDLEESTAQLQVSVVVEETNKDSSGFCVMGDDAPISDDPPPRNEPMEEASHAAKDVVDSPSPSVANEEEQSKNGSELLEDFGPRGND